MPRRRQQLVQHDRAGRRLIGDRLGGSALGRADGPLDEPAGRPDVAPRGDQHVDDLAELVDCPVDVHHWPATLHIGLVDLPAISNTMSARPSSLGQQRREPLHPAINGDVVDLDAPFGEQLLDVAVGEAEAQVPVTTLEATGSGLIAALEQTWADIRRRTPERPKVVVVTGTGLSSSAFHIDAK
jgi:hypothetical protein